MLLATVQGDTVELHLCPPSTTNHYGAFLERRSSTETNFASRPCFFSAHCNRGPLRECICNDVVPRHGIWYYRMRMIGLDGAVSHTSPIEVGVGVTSVGEGESPLTLLLKQNYPNPFNPTTRIEYAIPYGIVDPKTSHVSLKVFDVLGREVATLVDELQDAGGAERHGAKGAQFKSVEFDASGLASGVYFYTLRAGEFTATKRLVVIK